MAFNLKIENFGKLSDAEIRIGRFTVLAGPNDTGKSFVSRLLYSLFNAMNIRNHALVGFNDLASGLRSRLVSFSAPGYSGEDRTLSSLDKEIDSVGELVSSWSFNNSEELEDQWNQVVESVRKLLEKYKPELKRLEEAETPGSFFSAYLKRTERELEIFCEKMEKTDPRQLFAAGLEKKISGNLLHNFQVERISDLNTQTDKPSKVYIDGIGKFEFANSESVDFDIEKTNFWQLQEYSRVIYLESPFCWKLKLALERLKRPKTLSDSPHETRDRLIGVPEYFYDLAGDLSEKYTGDIAFRELYEYLTSERIIGGKLVISDITGELFFLKNGRAFPLSITAIGVANIGMLALLIERKIIDEGTFLFIDEPEAHLHPEWQIEIVRVLLELSRKGVNVVIATHSTEIVKLIQNESKRDDKTRSLIALNHFSSDGVKSCTTDDFDSAIQGMLAMLTDPYYELYLEGLPF